MSILCVDDEPAVAMIVEHTLREAGHETVGARNVPGGAAGARARRRGADHLRLQDARPFRPRISRAAHERGLRHPAHHAHRLREHRARGRVDQGRRRRLHHEARAPRAADARGRAGARAGAAAEGECDAAPRNECGAQRAPDPGRQRGDAARPAVRRHRRAHARHRPSARRIRHREGIVCARDPRHERSPRQAVHQAELRRASRGTDRECALRPREGCVHRRDQAGRRRVRARESRDAASR